MTLLMSYCYFCQCQRIQLRWNVLQQSLVQNLWGTVFRGGHFCVTVPCLCHLQHSFDNYITWDILQFMALGQRCPTVASVEAVIVIKTCCDSILSPVCCITFRILCLVDLSAPKGLSNTGNPMVSVCMRLSPVVLQRGHRNGGFGVRACLKYGCMGVC